MKRVVVIVLLLFAYKFSNAQKVYCKKALASYYANMFEGRTCASGQIFHQSGFTAAHRTLKFGTKLKITNLQNDSSIVVVVNDRMPDRGKCEIDLTLAAARRLNFVKQGIAKVRIEIIEDTVAASGR